MVHLHPRLSIVPWLVAGALGLSACGSGQSGHPVPPGAGPSPSGHESVFRRCAEGATGDPARLSLCLASHRVRIEPNGPLLTCLSSANDRSSVFSCLNRYDH